MRHGRALLGRMVLARERFDRTRDAVGRLDEVHALIMTGCDDWHPDSGKGSGIGDPTANRAIRNVDVLADKLEALKAEEQELTRLIGDSLVIIQAVRDGLGEEYGDVLEARYIDCWQWQRIADDYGIPRSTGHYLLNIAFDWIDSVGVARLMRWEYEL